MPYTLSGVVIVMTSAGRQEFPWAKRVRVEKNGNLHIYGDLRRHHVFEAHEWTAYLSSKREGLPES